MFNVSLVFWLFFLVYFFFCSFYVLVFFQYLFVLLYNYSQHLNVFHASTESFWTDKQNPWVKVTVGYDHAQCKRSHLKLNIVQANAIVKVFVTVGWLEYCFLKWSCTHLAPVNTLHGKEKYMFFLYFISFGCPTLILT